jgi:DNA-binding NtrC family response regulator
MTGQNSHPTNRNSNHAPAHKNPDAPDAVPVIIVDDDQQIVDTLRVALEREGYPIKTASDGMEAYNLIKAHGCRCMVLDVHMPRISGVELLLLMQAEGLHVPTIVMATFIDFNEREMKEFTNVVKYLPKPFHLADMVAAVRECVRP